MIEIEIVGFANKHGYDTFEKLIMQCENVAMVESTLKEMEIDCVKNRVMEGGISVDQLFFHDPDGFVIEVCDCNNLPVVPLKELDFSIREVCLLTRSGA